MLAALEAAVKVVDLDGGHGDGGASGGEDVLSVVGQGEAEGAVVAEGGEVFEGLHEFGLGVGGGGELVEVLGDGDEGSIEFGAEFGECVHGRGFRGGVVKMARRRMAMAMREMVRPMVKGLGGRVRVTPAARSVRMRVVVLMAVVGRAGRPCSLIRGEWMGARAALLTSPKKSGGWMRWWGSLGSGGSGFELLGVLVEDLGGEFVEGAVLLPGFLLKGGDFVAGEDALQGYFDVNLHDFGDGIQCLAGIR